jgi:MoxR-like ATPase
MAKTAPVEDNGIILERLPSSEFAPVERTYVDVFDLHPLYDGLFGRAPTILVGPKGIGKSLSVQSYAHVKDCPIVTFDCSEDVRRTHLLGSFVLRGQQTPYVLGPITTAFEVANEVGKCILCLEEINALTPQQQKLLNAISDFRKSVVVPECKRVYRLNDGCQLWLVGTMNFSVYGGVYSLNEDLKSRFRQLALDYPGPKDEAKIVTECVNGLGKKLTKTQIDQCLLLAHETRQQAYDYALSTRDVVAMVEDIAHLGVVSALRLILGKFEGEDRTSVKERMKSIFSEASELK